MSDQKFSCGRYKNRTFEDIAKSDVDFCQAVLKSPVCNKYYPEEFKAYLLSLQRSSINESNVTSFVKKWDDKMKAEFRQIIGSPTIDIRNVHPKAEAYPNGNLGVFIRYFIKKCIFNIQDVNASNYNVDTFASIFPFKVSKNVPLIRLSVQELYDQEFYSEIERFMSKHFEDKYDADSTIELFLCNINDFKQKYFNSGSFSKLKSIVEDAQDPEKSTFTCCFANAYMRQFPRLSKAGVERYNNLRQVYNSLCATFGLDELGEQRKRHIRMLPEITCYEVLSLLEPDLYEEHRAKYVDLFQKYLFFFSYAIDCDGDNPVFFIDDPLYGCLKGYVEYKTSREAPENLHLYTWLVTLVHRRNQRLDGYRSSHTFDVDAANLHNIREYIENFPNIESAIVDFVLPTNLLLLGIPFVTSDAILNVFYSNAEKSNLTDFYEGIIRALMCPLDIKKIIIYNAYTGMETSMVVPSVKKEILNFIRKYNQYDHTRPVPPEFWFTDTMEEYFEIETIQWNAKCVKEKPVTTVYSYEEILGDV